MVRYQVILAYDGTQFQGFQRQANARTVQSEVEAALRRIGWQGASILAAGRTDTGVHAFGQVIAFDLEWKHPLTTLHRALNAELSEDISAKAVRVVHPKFHPRYAATGRRYQYRLFCDEVRDPLWERYAWRVWPPVNLQLMQEASFWLRGQNDFAAFGRPTRVGGSTVRLISEAGWQEEKQFYLFDIIGNAFLYRMVRNLVYVQVKIGQNELKPEMIHECLSGNRILTLKGVAPPTGLTLVEIYYPPEELEAYKYLTESVVTISND